MIDNPALTRYAIELDEQLDEILNSDAEMGVSFGEVIEAIENLYVNYEPAGHLVRTSFGKRVHPTHVPPIAADPILHVLVELAFEVASLPLTVRTIEAADRLIRFKRRTEHLLRILSSTTRFEHR